MKWEKSSCMEIQNNDPLSNKEIWEIVSFKEARMDYREVVGQVKYDEKSGEGLWLILMLVDNEMVHQIEDVSMMHR